MKRIDGIRGKERLKEDEGTCAGEMNRKEKCMRGKGCVGRK